jgi:hypothetical protein
MFQELIGSQVIVRTYSAGVHYGTLRQIGSDGKSCKLEGARRIWKWLGAFTLSELSQKGPSLGSKLDSSDSVFLTEAIEYLVATPTAVAAFAAMENYKP